MKALFFIQITVLVILAGCSNQSESDELKAYIPGTYIRFSQHEFGKENDTLIITLQNETANEYNIMRNWKYERVLDGNPIEPEYKKQATSAIYNENSKSLQETGTGNNYTFDNKQNVLFAGKTKYEKLK